MTQKIGDLIQKIGGSQMKIESRLEDKNTLVVKVSGELDLSTAEQFKLQIEQDIKQWKAKNLILDLNGVNFIDSSGLGVILGRYKTVTQNNGNMAIVKPKASVKKILELSGILRIIKIYKDVDAALTAI